MRPVAAIFAALLCLAAGAPAATAPAGWHLIPGQVDPQGMKGPDGNSIFLDAPEGLILHAAGRTDEGVRIIEVWESEEAWHRFVNTSEGFAECRFSGAPRHLREFEPTHLVIAGDTS